MPRLNLSNNFETTLANGITETDTLFNLTDATGAPATPFRATIYEDNPKDGEIVEVGSISGNTLSNVLRGLEGTYARAWVAGMKFAVLGTAGTYGELVSTDDYRLSDAREPTAHKNTHATGGSDALTPSDIGASADTHGHNAVDISYDNADTGLTAMDVQAGIDELFSKTATIITQNIIGYHWVEKGLMPIPTNFAKATEYSGTGYYICPDGFLKYDATTDTWTSLSGPTSNIDRTPGITAYDGYIYIIGGQYSGLQFTCYKYEIASGTYQTISPMTADERGLNIAAITCNGLIYAGGGKLGVSGSISLKNGFYKYNPGTDTWTQLANLPESAEFAFETDGANYIYAFSANNNIYQYDITGNTWSTLNATFNNLYAPPRVKKLGDYIYILTATSGEEAYLYKYDIAQDTVTALDNTNYNHLFGALMRCQTNDAEEPEKIYVAGGSQPAWSDKQKYVEEYNNIPATNNIISPLTGFVRWNDDSIEGVTKNESYNPPASGTAIFIGTEA